MTEVHKHGVHLEVSQEVLNDGIAIAEAWRSYQEATPAQRAEWAREAKEKRAAERAAAPLTSLSVDALLAKLGWSYAYARHAVQPYCYCSDGPDGWDYCQHAYDEGVA